MISMKKAQQVTIIDSAKFLLKKIFLQIGESIQQDNSIMEDSMIAGGKKKKIHRDNSI